MAFSPACHLVKINNALGFYLDQNTIVTACHNRNSDGSYSVERENDIITCYGELKNNAETKTDFIIKDDIQIIRDVRLTEDHYYEGKRFCHEQHKYLIGRRFRYPSFKHINNIKAAISVALPLERDYLRAVSLNGKNNIFLTNRLSQIEYCLEAVSTSESSIEDFVYHNTSVTDLNEIHDEYSVSYSEALLDELRLLACSVFSDVEKDKGLIDCACATMNSIYSITDLTASGATYDNALGRFITDFRKFDRQVSEILSGRYINNINTLSRQIIRSYYLTNDIVFDLNSNYLITVAEPPQYCIHLSGKVFQINAPSYPGFSGGPVLDGYSRAVGLVIGGRQSNLTSTLIPFCRNSQSMIRAF